MHDGDRQVGSLQWIAETDCSQNIGRLSHQTMSMDPFHYVLARLSHAAFCSLLVQSVFCLLVQDGDTLTRLISLGFNDTIATLLRTKWQNKVDHDTRDER